MSGHNKWSKIKRKKEIEDKAKGNIFSKLSRLITLAVIEGNGITDPNNNIKLRLAIDKAKQFNMPKENINRAIERGVGPDRQQLKEIIYEGFGPGGVAMIIEATTDNPNRTLSEVRMTLDRHQGKLGSQGSVNYLFKRCGLITVEKQKLSESDVLALAETIGGFDIEEFDDEYNIYFPYENLSKASQYKPEIHYKPLTTVRLTSNDLQMKLQQAVEALEQLDDVHRVFTNLE